MRIAIALLRYFPYGGLQRDARLTAELCRDAGDEVCMYVRRWDGPQPSGIDVQILDGGGFTNHGRARRFGRALGAALARRPVDAVLGFDRLPHLDAWFAADPCHAARVAARGGLRRFGSRARIFAELERSVAGPDAQTCILLVDHRQQAAFAHWYGTPPERFVRLPPGIAHDRVPGADALTQRAAVRAEFSIPDTDRLLLFLGSDFARKGLDRAIRALASLPEAVRARTHLVAAGADRAAPFERLAARLAIASQVRIVPGRDDVPRLLQGADLLVHPAREENTGTVLVEALVAGRPVLCSGACGYAAQVAEAGAGVVLAEPFDQLALDAALAELLQADLADAGERARAWARSADVHGMHARIREVLVAIADRRVPTPGSSEVE